MLRGVVVVQRLKATMMKEFALLEVSITTITNGNR